MKVLHLNQEQMLGSHYNFAFPCHDTIGTLLHIYLGINLMAK